MSILIIILNILAIFCAICMSERILVNTINAIKYKFNMTKLVANRISILQNIAMSYALNILSDRTKRICWYITLGISWSSFAALFYKAFIQ